MKDKAFQTFSQWGKIILPFLSKRKYGILILISSWCMADLALISLRPLFLSSKGLTYSPTLNKLKKPVNMAKYMPIWDFNIFHNGSIPPSLSTKIITAPQDKSPVLSRLPLQLNGIVIYENPVYSIASITIKGKNKSGAYRTGDEVEKMANITRIERERVYFINLNANAEEYIELPRKYHISSPVLNNKKQQQPVIPKISYIRQVGTFQFEINRSDLNKRLMRNLPDILQEAKVVPHWENGKMAGWRFEYIKKGSVYDHSGFKESDIVTSVDGKLPP